MSPSLFWQQSPGEYGKRKAICRKQKGRNRADGQKEGHSPPRSTSCSLNPLTPQPTSTSLPPPDFSLFSLSCQSQDLSHFPCISPCYGLNVCSPQHPYFVALLPPPLLPQCNGIWQWVLGSELGLDEIAKETLDGIHALQRRETKTWFSLSVMWGRSD